MRRALPLLALPLLIFSWTFAYHYYDTAFPELSLDYALDKKDVIPASDEKLKAFGLDGRGYRRVVTFGEYSLVKHYLELSYGLEALVRDIRQGINISNWKTRYFLPGIQEELAVRLDTEGRLTGYRHVIPETLELEDTGAEQAFRLATGFISRHLPRHPLDKLRPTEKSEKTGPGHTVYSFTWERTDWQRDDARYHLHIDVSGDRITRYHEHLDIPENWRRQYAEERGANQILQTVAEAVIVVILIGCLAWFVVLIIRHEIHWQGFPLYWIIPVAVLLLAAEFSSFPGIISNYQTQDDFNNFIASSSLQAFYGVALKIILFFVAAFVADTFWQRQFPQHLPIRSLLNGKGLATRQTMNAIGIGFVLASLTLAYVVAYYAAGKQFGIWVPSNIDYSKVLTSYFPAIEALSGGFSASWMEELVFRVMSILLIYRFSRSKWLAIIVSAAVWGFLHSNYPQMPGYARGIELTIEGTLLGWIALRYGILATFLSHCLYNTWLGAIIAWQTGSMWQMSMAVVVSVWPIGLWIKGYTDMKRSGRFTEISDLSPDSEAIRKQILESEAILPVTTTTYSKSVYAGLLLLLAVLPVIHSFMPDSPYAPESHISLGKQEIVNIADRALLMETGQDPATYKRMITHHERIPGQSLDYLLDYGSLRELSDYIEKYLYSNFWRVRYFRSKERDTYTVYVDQDGSRVLVNRSLSENTPGAELEIAEAIALAEHSLTKYVGIAADEIRYVSHVMKKHPARKDYTVTFELVDWEIGDSQLRWKVYIIGDEFNGVNQYLKLPESYLREISATGWPDTIKRFFSFISLLVIAIALVAINVLLIMKHYVPWKLCFKYSIFVPVIYLIQYLNTVPEFYAGYQTTRSILHFSSLKLLDVLLELGWSYIYTVLLCGVLLGLVRWITGSEARRALLPASRRELPGWYLRGLLFGAAGLQLIWALNGVANYTFFYLSDELALKTVFTPITGYLPALYGFSASLAEGIVQSLQSGIIVLLIILLWKEHKRLVIVLFSLLLISTTIDWREPDVALHGLFFQIMQYSVMLWLFVRLFRFNPVAYLVFYYYKLLLPGAVTLTYNAWPAYQGNIILIWIMLCLPIIALLPIMRLGKQQPLQATA